jgi:hypothetical protein
MVETGNGMLEAADEAYGFSFLEVSLRRLGTQKKGQQNCYEARGPNRQSFQRNPVELICVNADEVSAASGHDVGLEVFFAEKVQHLEHRLVQCSDVGKGIIS